MHDDWRGFIEARCADATFHEPASASAISELELRLGTALPEELTGLLAKSDGVDGEYGLGLIWNCERIGEDNVSFRNNENFAKLYMPFEHLVFFGDAGNGDQFALAVRDGVIGRRDLYVWDHENDSRTWVAPNVRTYIDWWLSGKISL